MHAAWHNCDNIRLLRLRNRKIHDLIALLRQLTFNKVTENETANEGAMGGHLPCILYYVVHIIFRRPIKQYYYTMKNT